MVVIGQKLFKQPIYCVESTGKAHNDELFNFHFVNLVIIFLLHFYLLVKSNYIRHFKIVQFVKCSVAVEMIIDNYGYVFY